MPTFFLSYNNRVIVQLTLAIAKMVTVYSLFFYCNLLLVSVMPKEKKMFSRDCS